MQPLGARPRPRPTWRPLSLTVDWEVGQLRLTGELDRSCAERVTNAVTALTLTARHTLVVDVSELTFCDVEGLRALAQARGLALSRGRRMRLVDPRTLLLRLVRLAGIDDLVDTPPADRSDPGAVTHLRTGRRRGGGADARAYCGPAHGQQWTVDPGLPPARVELPVGASSCHYRLVRQRRSGRPARDELGNLLYVPMTDGAPGLRGSVAAGRVLPFPRPPAHRGGPTAAARSPNTSYADEPHH